MKKKVVKDCYLRHCCLCGDDRNDTDEKMAD